MPLFKPRADSSTSPSRNGRASSASPARTGKARSSSNHRSVTPPISPQRSSTRRGIFGRARNTSRSPDHASSPHSSPRSRTGGFFGNGHNNHIDPSIVSARQKVVDAESAEQEADRALSAARGMVREAREHVKMVEREALEDGKRAKAKQAEAKVVSKIARGLGRHGT